MRPYKFIGHKGPVHDVAISPNGNLIASASGDETVRLWNNGVNGNSQTIKAHVAPVKSVDFNNEGRLLLTGSNDKIIKIINVADRKFQASLIGHNNWVRCARFSPDSRLVGSVSDDHTVKLWDVAQKTTIHTFIDHLEDVNTVRFHPDGTCIASGSVDKKIKIWDIRSKRLIQHYDAHGSSVTNISFHPTGNYLISASMDATLKIWDLKMGQILYTLYGHEGPATTVNFSNCGDFFCSGGIDSILMVWKSNVKNMDEEFESLTNSEVKMKSNRRKLDYDLQIENTVNIQGNSYGVKRSTHNIGDSNNKFNVTREEKKTLIKSSVPQTARNEEALESSNMFGKLPPELSSTFEKMISQLDIIASTMKIMDQRIATVENQISEIMKSRREKAQSVREDSKKSTKSAKQENFEMSGNYYENLKLSKGDNYMNHNMEYEYKNNQHNNDFKMSYTSSKLDKNENDIYPLNAINMYNYADTFKEEKDRASLSNVFNQNLGRSGVNHDLKNELYIQQEDNRLGEIENSNIIEDINDHEEKADYSSSLKQEYEDEIKQADNVEIYEDNNDHIEEFNEEANGERREDNEN